MKRTILILAIIVIAAPVWAAVTITATHEGCGVVRIDYNNTEPNRIRAFGLDVVVSDGNIVDVNDFFEGECNSVGKGYGVFPGSYDYNSTSGEVDGWGTPVGDPNYYTSTHGVGSNSVTLEMGGLWSPTGDSSPNAPSDSGTLCKVYVNDNCNLYITPNAKSGANGALRTDGTQVSPTVSSPAVTVVKYTGERSEMTPAGMQNTLANWRSAGRPDCWCPDCSDSSDNDPNWGRQCYANSDGFGEGKNYDIWVLNQDLAVFLAGWNKTYPECVGQTVLTTQKPDVQRYVPWACADADHLGEGKNGDIAVLNNDLALLLKYWNNQVVPDPNCP